MVVLSSCARVSRLDVLAHSGPVFPYGFHGVQAAEARKTQWNLVGKVWAFHEQETGGKPYETDGCPHSSNG
jgi:hypothetical protein